MARAKQPVSVNGIEFDALIDQTDTLEATVPEYTVEDGFVVSDAIILNPEKLDMTLYITDTPVTWYSRHGSGQDRVESIVKQLGQEIDECQKKIEEKEAEITRCWAEQKETCSEIYQQLKWHEQAFDLRHYAAYRDNYFFLVGWVPAAKADAFAEKVKQIRHMRVTISDPEEVENATPPTKLKNPWFVKPFEFFVDMYGLPSYGEMDITAFVAITFTVLFGIMFGDLGQGAVLAVGGFILWKWKWTPPPSTPFWSAPSSSVWRWCWRPWCCTSLLPCTRASGAKPSSPTTAWWASWSTAVVFPSSVIS